MNIDIIKLVALIVATQLIASTSMGQIVQLPTVGSFSLQNSVSVPDSGSAYLGGSSNGIAGNSSRGVGQRAIGSQMSSASASVRATIIDLNELDRMIRSQTGPKPTVPDLSAKLSTATPYSLQPKGSQARKAEYEYIAALSHAAVTPERMTDDSKYYLSLAANARQMGHWNAVELYYKLAWESLPESRRENALRALAESKQKAEKEAAATKQTTSSSKTK